MDIFNDDGSVRVMPKTWLRKYVWHEIDDMLKKHGFVWTTFENSCFWVCKPKSPDELTN